MASDWMDLARIAVNPPASLSESDRATLHAIILQGPGLQETVRAQCRKALAK
ncbi:MAG: hypothetical protein ACXVEX_13675 [Actinomycetota bacterium]